MYEKYYINKVALPSPSIVLFEVRFKTKKVKHSILGMVFMARPPSLSDRATKALLAFRITIWDFSKNRKQPAKVHLISAAYVHTNGFKKPIDRSEPTW